MIRLVLSIIVLSHWVLAAATSAAIPLGGQLDDEQISLIYDPGTGNLSIESQYILQAIELRSESRTFTPSSPGYNPHESCQGKVQICDSQQKLFLIQESGFDSDIDFGSFLPPDLSPAFLANDLTVSSLVLIDVAGRPNMGSMDLLFVPEPHSAMQVGGLILLPFFRRIRWRGNPAGHKSATVAHC